MKVLSRDEFEQANIFGTGLANEAFARYFIGESFLNPLTDPKECPLFLANVTFEPGCRNNWHIHHATDGGGQLLVLPAQIHPCLKPSYPIPFKIFLRHFYSCRHPAYRTSRPSLAASFLSVAIPAYSIP